MKKSKKENNFLRKKKIYFKIYNSLIQVRVTYFIYEELRIFSKKNFEASFRF